MRRGAITPVELRRGGQGAKQAKSVFAILCNQTPSLHQSKFFATREAARKWLKKAAADRKYKLGVHCFEEKEDGFSFLIGWEEHKVSFCIVELPIEE